MEINPQEILKLIDEERHKTELYSYWDSMEKLPEYDHSRFYANYPDYESTIAQGDVISDLTVVNLPNPATTTAKAMVFSSTCDIELQNARRFPSRIIYAPIIQLSKYEQKLRAAKDENNRRKFSDFVVKDHIEAIKKQEAGQIFYLPKGGKLEEDALVYFDQVCSCTNQSVSRENLNESRLVSLSLYGWHVFLYRLAHFFTRATDETVELRLKSSEA